MDNPKFDVSLLQPINDENSSFTANLTPMDQPTQEQDAGAYLDNLPSSDGSLKGWLRTIGANLGKLGHDIINTPHDLISVGEEQLGKMSNDLQKIFNLPKVNHLKVSNYIPKQPDYDFDEMVGNTSPTLMQQIIGGGIRYSPEILGGMGLLRGGFRALTGINKLKAVEDAAKKYGMGDFKYSPEVLEEAEKYMPKTEASRQLFARTKTGDYPASFTLRSQLGKHQRDLAKSPLASERLLSPQVGDLRQKMINQLEQGLRDKGMHAEADMLKQGIKNYAQYMRVKNAVVPVMKKIGIPIGFWEGGKFLYQKGKSNLSD